MVFKEAYEALKKGYKIKLPHWTGYWKVDDNSVKMYCKDGRVLDIRESEDIFYTLDNINADDWEVVGEEYNPELNVRTFGFGEAIRLMKLGKRVARNGWNGKGMFTVYQKAYPDGIPCNKQTAEAWGMTEGELFKCRPYLQIKNVDGSHSMWVPSIGDVLAEDWVVVE
jgi:hypothetical protein